MSSSRLLKNTLYLSIVQIVNFIFPLITIPYISRIIGPEGYGIFNYSTAFIGYFTTLIAYGFDLTGTRKIAKASGNICDINKTVSEVLSARIFLFIISILLFGLTLHYFKPIQKNLSIVIILFIGCIGTVISPQYIFQGLQKISIYAKLNFLKGFLNLGLVFILIKKSEDYIFLALLNTSFVIAINLFLFIYAIYKFKISVNILSLKKSWKIILNERMIFFSTVVISLYTATNTIVLGFFGNNKEIGYYTTSQSFLNIVNLVIAMPLSMALFPFIGKAFSISRENGIEKVKKIIPIVFYLTLGASICLMTLAPIFINFFYGHKFDKAIPALKIISFLPFILGLSNIFGVQLMLNMGLDKLFLKTTFIASIFGVFLNIFMSKKWGYIGTAWNCLIVESFVTLLMFINLRKRNIHPFDFNNFKIQNIKEMILVSLRKK
ncbi:flippase [Empedobacter sp.]|uniref:flippase n=1 Tax=Empedobacter sp. TaxID=1927715 RepID=UPI0028A26A50|nr:flippase [Empedobacter sp.]